MAELRPEPAERHDLIMGEAVAAAAGAIAVAPSFLERFIDDALGTALEAECPGAEVILRRHLPLTGWERLPGARTTRPLNSREADLQFVPAGHTQPAILSEQKVWDFDAALFDLAKLLTFGRLPGVISTYLVGADLPQRFESDGPGCALFADGPARRWHLAEIATGRWQAAWMHHLRNAGVAPREIPSRFTTRLVARADVPAFPGHELRCIRVDGDNAAPFATLRAGRLLGEEPPELDPDFEEAMAQRINEESRARFYGPERRHADS